MFFFIKLYYIIIYMAEQELKTYILPDKDKFYNWVYPTYEECAYKKEKHPNEEYIDFYLSQGQKFVKDFLVNSYGEVW